MINYNPLKSMVMGSLMFLSSCSYLEYNLSVESTYTLPSKVCTPTPTPIVAAPITQEYKLPPVPDIDSLAHDDVEGEIIMLLDYIDLLRSELVNAHK